MSKGINRWYLPVLATLGILLVALLALVATDRAMRDAAMTETRAAAEADAAILAAGLESELEKFSLVPRVLANDPQVRALLGGDSSQRAVLNTRLEDLAQQTGAAAIYLVDAQGMTEAASNWQLPTSFVGSDYSFRSYFAEALAQGTASEFALGTVSRRPGLYIAQRVNDGDTPLGVVALKVEFDAIEESWREAMVGAFVTDREGIVLIASDPDWRFRTTRPIAAATRSEASDALRYGSADLESMPQFATGSDLSVTSLMERTQPVARNGWDLHLIVDPLPQIDAAVANGRLAVLLGLIVSIAIVGGVIFWVRRREARAEAEMAEHTSKLRDQLQQANRLATLGQITAGVGHEIRQPVAAVRVFAENGEKLIAAGNQDAASENFAKIIALTARIGTITEELLGFSRRAAHPPKEMPLSQAIDSALFLLRDRFERESVTLVWTDRSLADTPVRGEHVRLEQVLINILQNALDASPPGGDIRIDVALDADFCRLAVTDSGSGINPDIADTLFQPFATTKETGVGLGLAISFDIMRDLGGNIVWENTPSGARFIMVIPRA